MKIGVLGGGQLGRMMALETGHLDVDISCMDNTLNSPAEPFCRNFVVGNIKDYNDVMNFGTDKDIITIEIEHVNLQALFDLRKNGKIIHPSPQALEIIIDKGKQREKLTELGIPQPKYSIFSSKKDILDAINIGKLNLPFVQKTTKDGYDGRGVQIIKNNVDLNQLWDGNTLIESFVDIKKEIGLILARNSDGEVKSYDPVEMIFNEKNLVDFILSPAKIEEKIANKIIKIGVEIIDRFDICGLLAIEFFLTKNGDILVNELAPRPHNSGHHTIENTYVSQFEQHIRAIMNMPLGSTKLIFPAVTANLLGAENSSGDVHYSGIENILKTEGAYLHLYGKKEVKPFRKMGHLTVSKKNLDEAYKIAIELKNKLIIN